MDTKKQFYEAPRCKVLEVKFEGMICISNRSLGMSSSTGSDNNVEDRQSSGVWGDGGWN
jgi:hypothetical protein